MTFVPMASVTEEYGGIDVGKSRPFEEVKKGYVQFRERDVLFAKITPCMENGKMGVVPKLDSEVGYGSTEFHVLRVPAEVDPRWVAHFVSQQEFRRTARRNMSGSAGQLRVPEPWLSNQAIPVAPEKEQQRIVEKLEELVSDLDAGIVALERARANLKRYRAAVLKAAVEGRLTEKWRAAHPKVELAEKLLERILVERRKKWVEAQIKKFAEKNQSPPKGWKDRYPEPVKPESASLPALPDRWCWATIDQCGSGEANAITDGPFGSNLKSEHYTDGGPRVIRLQNIGDGEFVDVLAHISQERYASLQKHAVSSRDVVIAMLGEVLPRACMIPDHVPPAIVKADCAKVSFNYALCLPEYANCALNSEIVRKRAAGSIKGVGRPRLNLSHVREIPIPLPPLKEQLEIWAAVSAAIESSRHQDREVATSIARSARLRQSILKCAFEGKLVPQDPKDEPASELLARIRAARLKVKGQAGGGAGVKRKGRRRAAGRVV